MRALTLILFLGAAAWGKTDPLVSAAEYYFAHNDYAQALRLWNEVLQKDPVNDAVAIRVADLQFLFEGRQAAKEGLVKHLTARGESLSRDSRRALVDRWRTLQTAFLTEDGQSLYLQAREKEAQGDCASAIALATRALVSEKGNLELIRFRARCEWKTENFAAHYESLRQAYSEFPFDNSIQEDLAEAHLRFQQPQRVVEMWQKDPEVGLSVRKRLALIFAYLDTGMEARAATLLVKPADAKRDEVVYNFLFGALAARRGSNLEALHYWEAFLTQLEKSPRSAGDSYRLTQRAEEVRAWVVRKSPPKSGPPVTKIVS